jgi:hypothetical protein
VAHQNNMFELNQAIADWRRRMLDAGIKSPVPLEELESHLREDLERQIRAGADAEQAFQHAVQRIGQGDGLKQEFEKLEDAKRRRTREVLRLWSGIAGAGLVYAMVGWTWWLGARQGKFEITWVEIVLLAGVVVPMLLFGWVGRSLAKHLPVINDNWLSAIAFGALFLAALLFRTIFPEISPTNVVHLQLAVLWCMSPLLGFGNCVSAWHERCEAFRKSNQKQIA